MSPFAFWRNTSGLVKFSVYYASGVRTVWCATWANQSFGNQNSDCSVGDKILISLNETQIDFKLLCIYVFFFSFFWNAWHSVKLTHSAGEQIIISDHCKVYDNEKCYFTTSTISTHETIYESLYGFWATKRLKPLLLLLLVEELFRQGICPRFFLLVREWGASGMFQGVVASSLAWRGTRCWGDQEDLDLNDPSIKINKL